MKVKEQSETTSLKLDIHKTKIMASGPITSWKIEGEKWRQWQISFSWAPKSLRTVTAAMKLKTKKLLLGRKVMTNLDNILKSAASLCQQRLYSQSYGFTSSHVCIWELVHKEGWVLKNFAFKLWCWRSWVLWTERTSNQSILKEINPKYSLEGLMLKL